MVYGAIGFIDAVKTRKETALPLLLSGAVAVQIAVRCRSPYEDRFELVCQHPFLVRHHDPKYASIRSNARLITSSSTQKAMRT